jgi:hypothetical protein
LDSGLAGDDGFGVAGAFFDGKIIACLDENFPSASANKAPKG